MLHKPIARLVRLILTILLLPLVLLLLIADRFSHFLPKKTASPTESAPLHIEEHCEVILTKGEKRCRIQ